MIGAQWRIAQLAGFPIFIEASWLFILALPAASVANGFLSMLDKYFRGVPHQLPRKGYWILTLPTAPSECECEVP